MFTTIIRYADINNINKSIKLDEIQGIVVIDEILSAVGIWYITYCSFPSCSSIPNKNNGE